MSIRVSTGVNRFVLLTLGLLFVTLPVANLLQPKHVSALAGSNFSAGHIIDDVIFTNNNAMSVTDIQNFLNAEVGTCDNNGTGSAAPFNSSMTRAQYDASIGENTKFTCINQYYENTTTLANNLDGNPIPSGAISAAQIIYNAAQEYQINPEVILATLQKEQGLVTDTWPWDSEYTEAMGYGCPDSQSTCESQYYGFYNQVNDAAWQFQQYMNNPNSYNYVVGSNQINYHYPQCMTSSGASISCSSVASTPGAVNCGIATVNIQNQATAALYDYTPYQPNAAALANVSNSSDGGTGNSCSSYGNRNFWWYFNEWFGSSLAPAYGAAYYSESAFPTLAQGQSTNVTLDYENVGNTPWYDTTDAAANGQYPVTLATYNPINRASDFYSPSWASVSRPATTFTAVYNADGTLTSNQHEVQPGEIASYTFQVTVPRNETPGTYQEYFLPIREGAPGTSWFMGADTVHMNITVQRADRAQYVAESAYPTINQNDSTQAYFEFENTGTVNWYDSTDASANNESPIELSTYSPGRASSFSATWPSSSIAVDTFTAVYEADGTTLAANQHVVEPGQIAQFSFTMTASLGLSPGTYREYFTLIRNGAPDSQVDSSGAYLDVTVDASQLEAAYSSESSPLTLQQGQTGTMFFNFKNNGNVNWYDDTSKTPGVLPVHLATAWPINRASAFYTPSSWASVSRPNINFTAVYEADGTTLAANQHVVEPGQIAQFSFTVTAPANIALGTYDEHFQPIVEGAPGSLWDMSSSVWQSIQVTQ